MDTQELPEVSGPDLLVLKFADSAIPTFKEVRGKEFIQYGEDNKYPEYLTYLFNKSSKHNAIITGKANYIFGEGYENGEMIINRLGESLNDIAKKAILDIEIYAGFRWEVIWNRARRVQEIYHVDYTTIRNAKDGGFYYKEGWDKYSRNDGELIAAFDPSNPVGRQVYAYNEYRPMARFYPLPGYIGCNNFIETDIEIGKYYLSAIRNGMMPSKMIQFFKGEPSDDKKRQIERRFSQKFTGSENAGKFIMVFNDANASKSVEVNDLSSTDLDKLFVELNKTCQQEIFSGHLVTSPMLFGIKTEGQLGGTTELKAAYEIFQSTYAKPKANAFDREVNNLLSYSAFIGDYTLRQTGPIGIVISDSMMEKVLSPEEIRLKLGLEVIEKPVDTEAQKTLTAISSVSPLVATKILDNLTKNEIRGLAGLPAVDGGDVSTNPDGTPLAAPMGTDNLANDHIKNLTAKQHQELMRIIRQYSKGMLTEKAAKVLLRSGLGLPDEDINDILGIEAPLMMSADTSLDEVIAVFDEFGESKEDYEIIKSKKVSFSSNDEMEIDEDIFIEEAFKEYDVSRVEGKIIDLIKTDKRITPKVISEAIGESESLVKKKIAQLISKGYIEKTIEKVGVDEVVNWALPEPKVSIPPPVKDAPKVISIKYSYEVKPDIGPAIIPTTRPFCVRMVQLNRLYSRAEIEKISDRLGYSVWDRKGGWWGPKEECRHRWVSNIVVKKRGDK